MLRQTAKGLHPRALRRVLAVEPAARSALAQRRASLHGHLSRYAACRTAAQRLGQATRQKSAMGPLRRGIATGLRRRSGAHLLLTAIAHAAQSRRNPA